METIHYETEKSTKSNSEAGNRTTYQKLNPASNIILKSINNKTNQILLDLSIPINELLKDIMDLLGTNNISHDLKLIYSGKILSFDKSLNDYGVKENHVLLYMLKEKNPQIHQRNENDVSNNLRNLDVSNVNNSSSNQASRGFDQLIDYGASRAEIQQMRLLFHATYVMNRGGIDNFEDRGLWTREAIIQREEDWIQNNNNGNNLNNSNNENTNNISSQLSNMILMRRLRIMGSQLSNDSVLEVGMNDNQQVNVTENPFNIIIGFILGLLIGVYVLILVRGYYNIII